MIRLILVGDEDDLNCPLAGEWGRRYCWGRCFAEEEPTGLHWGRHQGQGALPVDSQGSHVSGRLCCFLRVVSEYATISGSKASTFRMDPPPVVHAL